MKKLLSHLLAGSLALGLSGEAFAQATSGKTPANLQVDERGGHGGRLGRAGVWQAAGPHAALSTSATSATTADACNLLPNPSFDDQNVNPLSGNRYNVRSPGANSDELSSWHSTNGSSPDYYATNAPVGSQSNPNTTTATYGSFMPHNNSQDPSAHNGTVGLFISTSAGPDQEYITPNTPLSLVVGSYYAAFWAYRATKGSPDATKLGMNITSGMDPTTSAYAMMFPRASTSIESPGYLQNSSWTLVSGLVNITAGGTYYANIGNLSSNDHAGTGSIAYYFIDDVALYRIPTAGPPATVACGASVTIGEGCDIPGAAYAWSTGNGSPVAGPLQMTVRPNATTKYTLTVTLPGSALSSATSTTVTVTPSGAPINSPDINLAPLAALQPQDNGAREYDVRVNNVGGATSFTLRIDTPDGNGGWVNGSPYTYGSGYYTGADDPNNNEAQGFTTFHTHLIGPGPQPSAGPGATYRFVVTASSLCTSVVATKVITLPPYNDGGQQSSSIKSKNPGISTPEKAGEQVRFATTEAAYPNPVTDALIVDLTNNTSCVALYNIRGQAMTLPQRVTGGQILVDTRTLPAGLYHLQIISKGNATVNKQIVVQH